MNITIRRASLEDLDLLLAWRMRVLREVFNLPSAGPMTELERENRRYYRETLPAEGHIACFACAGGEIVGCGGVCIYQELPSPDNPGGWCAYLMNIYTLPAVRRRGVGGKIVRWLMEQAERRGITKIYLETSESGRPLYERLGFSDMDGYLCRKMEKHPERDSPI